jgi:hypothetical protein
LAIVRTPGSSVGYFFFFSRAVISTCISFVRPRAVPWLLVGTRATRPSSRPLSTFVWVYGGPIGPVPPAVTPISGAFRGLIDIRSGAYWLPGG